MKKKGRNPFLDGNFMDYLNPEEEYGMYREDSDDTGLGKASRLTTEPNDLFGFYGEPEQSYSGLSEFSGRNLSDEEKGKQYSRYKRRRKDILKTGGQATEGEKSRGQNQFQDQNDLYHKSSSGGIGGFGGF